MIASLSGTVAGLTPTAAVVEVGGVGLLVQCTPATLSRLRVGAAASLATTLVVRETELTLYGFADADERDAFETLQGAGGVGPKLAQAVLGVLGPDEVRRAVADEDLAALTRVPGIGRKGAQRIVLDLKGKIGSPVGGGARARAGGSSAGTVPLPAGADVLFPGGLGAGASGAFDQVRAALANLGYSAGEAEDALAAVRAAPPGDAGSGSAGAAGADVAALLRAALAFLRPR
jgi:Holliday junction DNA helicase RuvA